MVELIKRLLEQGLPLNEKEILKFVRELQNKKFSVDDECEDEEEKEKMRQHLATLKEYRDASYVIVHKIALRYKNLMTRLFGDSSALKAIADSFEDVSLSSKLLEVKKALLSGGSGKKKSRPASEGKPAAEITGLIYFNNILSYIFIVYL